MAKFIVIGGGIAGVTCAEQLSTLRGHDQIILISSSPLIKAVTNVNELTRSVVSFNVEERSLSSLNLQHPNITVHQNVVKSLDASSHTITTDDGIILKYDKVCLCMGASPKLIVKEQPRVIGIRDTQSVQHFQELLSNARRVIIVGNGGIATELVHEIRNCQVIWAIKDTSISSTFFDIGAGQFLLSKVFNEKSGETEKICKRLKYTLDGANKSSICETGPTKSNCGSALGPDWHANLTTSGGLQVHTTQVHIEYSCEVDSILTDEEYQNLNETATKILDDEGKWPVYVKLTNDKLYGSDFVISATGVIPNTTLIKDNKNFRIADDGGVFIDEFMRTNVTDVYAAGDVCTAGWDQSPHWFQMRLWTQARQMGNYAAKCMAVDVDSKVIQMDFCFELFTHVTKFFGYKVVLLGQYNAQKLGKDYEILLRYTKDIEYVKVILHNGRMYGAILIGETDLEETFENLILNQMDLSNFGESLLDPSVDIEDYFD